MTRCLGKIDNCLREYRHTDISNCWDAPYRVRDIYNKILKRITKIETSWRNVAKQHHSDTSKENWNGLSVLLWHMYWALKLNCIKTHLQQHFSGSYMRWTPLHLASYVLTPGNTYRVGTSSIAWSLILKNPVILDFAKPLLYLCEFVT